MKRAITPEINSGSVNFDESKDCSQLSKVSRNSQNSVVTTQSNLSQDSLEDLSGLEKLPDVTKKMIFSYLDMRDLKKLTLMSSKLNWDAKSLDRRFSMLSVSLNDDLTVFENLTVYRKDIKISLDVQFTAKNCKEKLEEKFIWIRSTANKITHLTIDVENVKECDNDIVEKLVSRDLIFPVLKTVDLSINSLTPDMVYKLLMKFGSKIETLDLLEVDFRKFRAPESIQWTSLKVVRLKDLPGISRLLEILPSSTQSLEELEIDQRFEDVRSRDNLETEISMPLIQDNFLKLTNLKLDILYNDHEILNLKNFFEKCAATLTYLELVHVKTDFSLSTNFSALKRVTIDGEGGRLLNDMLCKTLEYIKIYLASIAPIMFPNLNLDLPFLTELAIEYESSDVSWLLLEILRAAPNLTSLRYDTDDLEFNAFDQLECNFPSLKHVLIWSGAGYEGRVVSCGRGLNYFLKGCPNLRTLYLCEVDVDLDVKLKHLNKLLLFKVTGYGLDKLVSSCASRLKVLCLVGKNLSVLDSAIKKGMANLKQLNIYPHMPFWIKKLKSLSLQFSENLELHNQPILFTTWITSDTIPEFDFRLPIILPASLEEQS